jgi:hypothetical protein
MLFSDIHSSVASFVQSDYSSVPMCQVAIDNQSSGTLWNAQTSEDFRDNIDSNTIHTLIHELDCMKENNHADKKFIDDVLSKLGSLFSVSARNLSGHRQKTA